MIPRFDTDYQVKEKVYQVASFTATCTLQQNSDECGYPFCDKMVLSVQGHVYIVEDAIVSSLPDAPVPDDTCLAVEELTDILPKEESPLKKELREMRSNSRLFRGGKRRAPAKAAYAPDHGYDHPQLYKVAAATVYYGAMQVISREHNVKTHSGWFEHVSRIIPLETITPVAYPEGHYVLDPYVYKLTFIKNKGY